MDVVTTGLQYVLQPISRYRPEFQMHKSLILGVQELQITQ